MSLTYHASLGFASIISPLRCPCSTSRSVSKAFPDDIFDGERGAGHIINPESRAVGVMEIEFSEVAFQVGFAHMLIDAINPTLKDREVAFDAISISIVPDIPSRRIG
jgi:hypothetical protein